MKTILDLHIHSRFSRACSKDLTLPNIARWCERKGIDIVGTGDFTHPVWLSEIKNQLTESEPGIFRLRIGDPISRTEIGSPARFMLTTELSSIYKQGDKVRRVHHLICMPTIAAVERLVAALEARGCNLKSDGRPILGLNSKELLQIVLEADSRSLLIPAHAWTPWFAIFGSESGFDSIEECFGDELAKEIHAIETGLSSDPPMNWRLSALDRVMLVSNSDAHSLRNLGREANQLDLAEQSFDAFSSILKNRDRTRFLQTLEFFPEEGKYHADGHRLCGARLTPAETKRQGGKCPVCGKPVTVGVLHRVDALADRPEGTRSPSAVPFTHLVPLEEVIADTLGKGKGTKTVNDLYLKLTDIAPEFSLLFDFPLADLAGRVAEPIIEALRRLREGKVKVLPGYDGEYGTIKIFSEEERRGPAQGKLI
ncbi:DNA helicase UvrD [Patescibacteria group bacterium]|nr:MAG: DNA helicase UvrD [Patescibacteria group bacterium]